MPPGCHLFSRMCQFLLSLCGFLKSFFRVKLTHCQAERDVAEKHAVFEATLILISFLSGRPGKTRGGRFLNQLRGIGALSSDSRFLWFISSAAHVSGVANFYILTCFSNRTAIPRLPPSIPPSSCLIIE